MKVKTLSINNNKNWKSHFLNRKFYSWPTHVYHMVCTRSPPLSLFLRHDTFSIEEQKPQILWFSIVQCVSEAIGDEKKNLKFCATSEHIEVWAQCFKMEFRKKKDRKWKKQEKKNWTKLANEYFGATMKQSKCIGYMLEIVCSQNRRWRQFTIYAFACVYMNICVYMIRSDFRRLKFFKCHFF